MSDRNVDPRLATLAADYAAAACGRAPGWGSDGLRVKLGEYTIEVFFVYGAMCDDITDLVRRRTENDDWWGYRIRDASDVVVKDNEDYDHEVYKEAALAEAWLQFARFNRKANKNLLSMSALLRQLSDQDRYVRIPPTFAHSSPSWNNSNRGVARFIRPSPPAIPAH
jgi:hypothetical protein